MDIEEVIIDDTEIDENLYKDEQEEGDMDDEPIFTPLSSGEGLEDVDEIRKIPIPSHRYSPLKAEWVKICTPIVHNLKLQIRMNTKTRNVEIKTSELTEEENALQNAADFVKAFVLGFDVEDAIALLRLDDLYIDSFQVDDVKMLKGEHLSRAIGRVAGKDGRTKFAIENATQTRIVLADKHVHILGSFNNIKIAKDAICALILGSPPGKVYGKLKTVASRVHERY
eukprot:TRINITY_DN9961_c0_g1_i1.p1 TRINITY_DN9961_c0_g1~~TRINITY_DN9961_c0_g1_i1.p1  ORF type:complete len:226 (+),score=48.97 TRINITY_DN9961_c0_g1_i1:53-730(+)